MRSFKDTKGREWIVEITVDTIKRVKALIDVDLMEVLEVKLMERLASDPILLCDVVYAVCKPQADSRSVSDADFGAAMAGDAIDAAVTALLEELVDFFPSARRAIMAKALTKVKTLEDMALQRAKEIIDSDRLERAVTMELDKVDARMEASLSNGAVGLSGNSPGSPESTPDP